MWFLLVLDIPWDVDGEGLRHYLASLVNWKNVMLMKVYISSVHSR